MRELTIYAKGLTLGFDESQIVRCTAVDGDVIGYHSNVTDLDLIQLMMLTNTVSLKVQVEGQEPNMSTGQIEPNGKKYYVTYLFRPEDVNWTSITEELDE